MMKVIGRHASSRWRSWRAREAPRRRPAARRRPCRAVPGGDSSATVASPQPLKFELFSQITFDFEYELEKFPRYEIFRISSSTSFVLNIFPNSNWILKFEFKIKRGHFVEI
jgi:hypothetical protein